MLSYLDDSSALSLFITWNIMGMRSSVKLAAGALTNTMKELVCPFLAMPFPGQHWFFHALDGHVIQTGGRCHHVNILVCLVQHLEVVLVLDCTATQLYVQRGPLMQHLEFYGAQMGQAIDNTANCKCDYSQVYQDSRAFDQGDYWLAFHFIHRGVAGSR